MTVGKKGTPPQKKYRNVNINVKITFPELYA